MSTSNDRLEASVRALVGDGDWSARGVFLRNCESFRPAVEAVSAVDALARLFPRQVVQAMIDTGDRRSLSMVFPLFLDGWTPGHGTLLHLGADLSRCPQWVDHRHLVTRLRTYAEHDGARFEVGLWAGACREGLATTYNDPGQGPNCDLVLQDGLLTVHVEAKAVDIATVSHNRSELLRAISDSVVPFLGRFGDGGYQLAVAPHRALLVAALNDLPEFEKLAEDFRRELQKWCSQMPCDRSQLTCQCGSPMSATYGSRHPRATRASGTPSSECQSRTSRKRSRGRYARWQRRGVSSPQAGM